MDRNRNQKVKNDVETVLNQLKEELNEKKDKSKISQYVRKLSENMEYLINNHDFYLLPMKVIVKIIKHVVFEEIDGYFQFLQKFISNLTNKHKTSILILLNSSKHDHEPDDERPAKN